MFFFVQIVQFLNISYGSVKGAIHDRAKFGYIRALMLKGERTVSLKALKMCTENINLRYKNNFR